MSETVSVYDTLLALPLFRGVSKVDVALLLEQMPLEFLRFRRSDNIVSEGDECDALLLVLSGSVAVRTTVYNNSMTLQQVLGAGMCIMPDALFGLYNSYPVSVSAVGDTGLLRIEKPTLYKIFERERICLLNYLNQLSYRSQILRRMLAAPTHGRLRACLNRIVTGLGERRAESTVITMRPKRLAGELGMAPESMMRQLRVLATHDDLSVTGNMSVSTITFES